MLEVRGDANSSLLISSYSFFSVVRIAFFGSFISKATTVLIYAWRDMIFCKVRTLFVYLILLKKAGF